MPEDPFEALMHAYLVETDTKSEPFKDPVETKTPESPHTVASPTLLPDSTPPTGHAEESEDFDTSGVRSTLSDSTAPLSSNHPLTHTSPTLVPLLRRTARMAVHVSPAMSPGLSANIAEVAAMSDSAFRKRFRSSPLTREDEEVDESSDSDSESEDAEDEAPTAEDGGPALGDEGLAAGDEDPNMRVESLGLGGEEAIPKGQQRAAPVVETAASEPLGLGYGALRRWEIASREGQMPSVFELGQGSGFVPEPERPERVSVLRQPTLTTWIDLEDGRVYIGVPAYPPPAPPAGQTDAQRVALWHAIGDTQMENRELRLQIIEERRTRLDLAKIVASMRRGQEPRGDV
ncbi:hypothetical protein Tco_0986041 [Tanacetum coccineum]